MLDHLLVIGLHGLTALDETMGVDIVDAALLSLGKRVTRHVEHTLGNLADASAAREVQRGRWEATFSVEEGALTGEDDDPVFALLAALRRLINEAAIGVFGPTTASHAQAVVVALRRDDRDGLESSLAEAAQTTTVSLSTRTALLQTLRCKHIRTFLQPIVSLRDGAVIGMEALSRGLPGGPFERADLLFDAAARSGLSTAVEILCIQQALPFLDRLPSSMWLSVNASAQTIRRLYGGSTPGHALSPRLVVELTEHLPTEDAQDLTAIFRRLRAGGVGIALDDAGCGYMSLATVSVLQPEIVKLCQTVTRHMDRSPETLAALGRTVKALQRLGHRVLAEGVETEAQAVLMRDLGVDYGQGWYFGRPFPAEEVEAEAIGPAACFAAADHFAGVH